MKLIIDIPDEDYTSIRCEGLYYIGHDKLAESVTTAFQTAIPYEERPQGKWIYEEIRGILFPCCSICGSDNGTILQYDFCPCCGARMQKGGDTNAFN